MINERASKVIERLEGMDKQGETYTGEGRYGFRNPIRSDTGLLLHSIVLAEKPKRILELGTAYGLSGSYLASALPEGGTLTTIELFEPVGKDAQGNFDEAGLPVQVLTGKLDDIIPRLKVQFDMLFLDHEKKLYLTDFNKLRNAGLLTRDCIVLADNVTDRAEEMRDFHGFYINKAHLVFTTECGLLVMKL